MQLKDFILELEKQRGKIFKSSNGIIWGVDGIDYRLGVLRLIELTDTPFDSCVIELNVFSKQIEKFTELVPIKEEE